MLSALSAGASDAAPASGAAASVLSEEAALSPFPKVCCSQSEKPLPTQALPVGAQPDKASEAAASPEARRTVRRVIFFMQKTS